MLKRKIAIITFLAFMSRADAHNINFVCSTSNKETKLCYPFSNDLISRDTAIAVVDSSTLDTINFENTSVPAEPWVIRQNTISLPDGSIVEIEDNFDTDEELEDLLRNPDFEFDEEPILMAAWSEHDGGGGNRR